jgi:diacylglycerol kinase family enzyme
MIEQNRWGILYCPKRGIRRTQRRWEKIRRYLEYKKVAFDFVQSEKSSSVERLMTMLINNGYKTIVIVGGDSALNDAVNCLMKVEESLRNTISIGVIPNGVLNDYAKYWNYNESDMRSTVDALVTHRIRKIDIGCIHYTNKKDVKCHRYFLNCINIGLIASIMNLRRQTRHLFGSRTLSFIISVILLIFQRMEYHMHIKINTDVINRRVMTVCIGCGTGYGQTPNAVPYDGLLDISVVHHPAVTQLLEGVYLLFTGRFLNHKSVRPYRSSTVNILDSNRALVGIDGRLMQTPVGPFTVDVQQEVINFIIPQ